jgi:glycosyltransferase involved in cell wall biosynthesis
VPSTKAASQPVLPELAGAALVIAESFAAAQVAVANEVPRYRLWALALPVERLYADVKTDGSAEIAQAAKTVGGFLTDTETARESVERAAAAGRVPVVIYPPLALDRRCPSCTTLAQPADQPAEIDSAVAQLHLWRAMIEDPDAGSLSNAKYSFPAARMRGLSGVWRPVPATDWLGGATTAKPEEPTDPSADWSAEAQVRAAGAVIDAVTPQEPRSPGPPRPPRRTLVAGFDLKFVRELAERLDRRADLDVTVDDWPGLSRRTESTETLADQADSILAEWARPSAAWFSQHKRPEQLLVVRLHRYELDFPYPRDIVIENVDAVVYIAPLFGHRIRDELGWPVEKLVYIPNFLDVDWLDRAKLADARFTLGFVGLEGIRKRLDLALDLLATLRREDRRFTLQVRSRMPWNNRDVWSSPDERAYFGCCAERIEQDPIIRGAVIFDPPGRDMARWYRRAGHILSTSDAEGVHTSVAEGMASGAVPVVRPWAGAADIYGKEWIHASIDDAAAAVLENADAQVWAERAARAKAEVRRTHDPVAVEAAWDDLLHGEVQGARGCFAEYSSL